MEIEIDWLHGIRKNSSWYDWIPCKQVIQGN